jgi:hypothetical protein
LLEDWVEGGEDPSTFPNFSKSEADDTGTYVIVMSKRRVYHYSTTPVQTEIYNNFFAWGAGDELAMGALAAGATAYAAAEIACRFSSRCNLPIDFIDLC